MKKSIWAVFAAMLVLTGHALAGNFTEKQLDGFIQTMKDMDGLDEKYPDIEMDMFGDETPDTSKFVNSDGKMILFNTLVDYVEQNDALKSDMSQIVKSNGFKSLNQWAEVGNGIFGAYMALQFEETDMSGMEQMTPEMMAQLPPQAQAMFKMIDATKNVPAEDKELMRSRQDAFDAAMN